MEKCSRTKSVSFSIYILCENFSKIGPIIKKIPKFWDDPLKWNETKSNFVYALLFQQNKKAFTSWLGVATMKNNINHCNKVRLAQLVALNKGYY